MEAMLTNMIPYSLNIILQVILSGIVYWVIDTKDYYSWNGNEYTAYRQDYGVVIDLDGAGNIYTMTVSVKTSIDNETPGVVISKYDSSWQYEVGSGVSIKPEDKTFDFFREYTGIKVTSNGDVYFMGGIKTIGYENRVDVEVGENTYRVYPESLFVANYNVSGTLQWQRTSEENSSWR